MKSIVCVCTGGLGNQLFQYAHALTLSQRLGCELKVTYVQNTRDYELDKIGIPLSKNFDPVRLEVEYYGDAKDLLPEVESLHEDIDEIWVRGYFQDQRWFDHTLARSLFPPINTMSNTCAVHVRRGDYEWSGHGVLTMEWFEKAMNIVRVKNPLVRFFIFSDDIEWCHANLNDSDVFFKLGGSTMDDFNFMRSCESLIISHSTYGWWAAFLANPELVIYPDIHGPWQNMGWTPLQSEIQ